MIVAAALKNKATGLVFSMVQPARHHNVMHALYELTQKTVGSGFEQGFITNEGQFVDRWEGFEIATAHNQIIEKHGPSNYLFSEDMW